MAKKKVLRPGEKTPAQKSADTMRKKRLEAAAKKKQPDKPLVEKSKVEVAVYPRTGDNPDFEGVLDRIGLEKESSSAKPATMPATQSHPDKPATGDEILTVADVAEWIGWPFMLWSQTNELASLALTAKEATSIAEPVTSILNRHAAGKFIPPDYIDGLRAGARLTPALQDRFAKIKKERQRRAAAGDGDRHDSSPVAKGAVKIQQGADATTPKEI